MKQNQLFARGLRRTKTALRVKGRFTAADDTHRVASRQPALHKVNKVPEFLKVRRLGVLHE